MPRWHWVTSTILDPNRAEHGCEASVSKWHCDGACAPEVIPGTRAGMKQQCACKDDDSPVIIYPLTLEGLHSSLLLGLEYSGSENTEMVGCCCGSSSSGRTTVYNNEPLSSWIFELYYQLASWKAGISSSNATIWWNIAVMQATKGHGMAASWLQCGNGCVVA